MALSVTLSMVITPRVPTARTTGELNKLGACGSPGPPQLYSGVCAGIVLISMLPSPLPTSTVHFEIILVERVTKKERKRTYIRLQNTD